VWAAVSRKKRATLCRRGFRNVYCLAQQGIPQERSMSERNESDERGDAPSSSESDARNPASKEARRQPPEYSERGEDGGSTTSRPRGHTEDPDRTL
jgi:hypothetical protein